MAASKPLTSSSKPETKGSFAGRGFRYQDQVIAYLLARLSTVSITTAMPEKGDDALIFIGDQQKIALQIKSKLYGTFGRTQLERLSAELKSKAPDATGCPTRL